MKGLFHALPRASKNELIHLARNFAQRIYNAAGTIDSDTKSSPSSRHEARNIVKHTADFITELQELLGLAPVKQADIAKAIVESSNAVPGARDCLSDPFETPEHLKQEPDAHLDAVREVINARS